MKPLAGRKVYQVIATDSWKNFTYQFTELTGRQPMLLVGLFGISPVDLDTTLSKGNHRNNRSFLQDSIPVDAIILDLFWFEKR